MNEHEHDCGHTEAEHEAQLAEVLSQLFGMPEDVARAKVAELHEVDEMSDIVIYDVLYTIAWPGKDVLDLDFRVERVLIGKTSNHITNREDIPKILAIRAGVKEDAIKILSRVAVGTDADL